MMNKPDRKMRRRAQDLEGGLILAWRLPGGAFGRMAAGVLVASGLFAGAASMISVKGPDPGGPSRDAARVMVLRADNSASKKLISRARIESPFPDRWEPASDGRLAERMAEVTQFLEDRSAYQARLRPRLVEPRQPVLPDLAGDPSAVSMDVDGPGAGARPKAVPLPVKATSVALNGLAGRWGRRSAEWERANAAELMGSEARFMLGVTPDGVVELCMLMDKSKSLSPDAEVEMERWLRGQRLAPDPEATGIVWGMVRIRLETDLEEEGNDG